jgi:hypothetical protein
LDKFVLSLLMGQKIFTITTLTHDKNQVLYCLKMPQIILQKKENHAHYVSLSNILNTTLINKLH